MSDQAFSLEQKYTLNSLAAIKDLGIMPTNSTKEDSERIAE